MTNHMPMWKQKLADLTPESKRNKALKMFMTHYMTARQEEDEWDDLSNKQQMKALYNKNYQLEVKEAGDRDLRVYIKMWEQKWILKEERDSLKNKVRELEEENEALKIKELKYCLGM